METNIQTRRTPLIYSGLGIFCIASTLSGSGFRPLLVTRWPSRGCVDLLVLHLVLVPRFLDPTFSAPLQKGIELFSLPLSTSTALFPAPNLRVGLLVPSRVASRESQMTRTVQKAVYSSVSAIGCVKHREGARFENYVPVAMTHVYRSKDSGAASSGTALASTWRMCRSRPRASFTYFVSMHMRWSPDFFVAMARLLTQSVGLSISAMSRRSVSLLSSSSSFGFMAVDTPLEGGTLGGASWLTSGCGTSLWKGLELP